MAPEAAAKHPQALPPTSVNNNDTVHVKDLDSSAASLPVVDGVLMIDSADPVPRRNASWCVFAG